MNLQISVSQQTSPGTGWWKVMTLITVGIFLILFLAMQLPTNGIASRQPSQKVVSRSHSSQLSPRRVPVPTAPLAVPAGFIAANAQPRLTVTPLPLLAPPQPQPVQTPPFSSSGENAMLTVAVSH